MMKIVLIFGVVLCAGASAGAQVLRPGLGRVPGHGNRVERHDDRPARPERHRGRDLGHGHRHVHRPHFSAGYYHGCGWMYPRYYYESSGYYGRPYGSGAGAGLWLGALAGGIIGHNSGEFRHEAWRGAAWGAGLGWILGSVADTNRRAAVYEQPAPVVHQVPAAVVQAQPVAPTPRAATVTHASGSASPMTAANAMFGRK